MQPILDTPQPILQTPGAANFLLNNKQFNLGPPQPDHLTTRFKQARTVAWIIFFVAGLIQLGLLIWLIITAADTKTKLQNFELGFVNTCPPSSTQDSILIKAGLAAATLVLLAIGLIILSINPLKVKT